MSKILSVPHVINITIINEIFFILKIWHVFYTYSTSQPEAATFQVLGSHMPLVAITLDRPDLEYRLIRPISIPEHWGCLGLKQPYS